MKLTKLQKTMLPKLPPLTNLKEKEFKMKIINNIRPAGFLVQNVLKNGKLGKWKKAPKKDFEINETRISYKGTARFIKPIFEEKHELKPFKVTFIK